MNTNLELRTDDKAPALTHKRATTNGVRLHYVTGGRGPIVLCLHGWPETHREYLSIIERLGHKYRFIAPDLRGFADSEKPFSGYEPKTIAADMIGLLGLEKVDRFHILSHDLGGPPSVALAYLATDRALSLSTIETPFFGLDYPGYVDPRVAYWHLVSRPEPSWCGEEQNERRDSALGLVPRERNSFADRRIKPSCRSLHDYPPAQ
jgi:pimeloyl-ACP methyl ester carboxylesterase